MEHVLDFARGPLFRFTFAIMILGLARSIILTVWNIVQAWREAGDKQMPLGDVVVQTLRWLLPFGTLFQTRPVFSFISVLFHIGLLITPIFLYAHVQLVADTLGFAWPTLPHNVAHILTALTIVTAILLVLGRVLVHQSSFLSRKQDILWPPLLAIPFATGLACAWMTLPPAVYQWSMLIHVLSAELIFVLIPFTKIAHCVLLPFSQLISVLGWKFPADSGEKVAVALNKKGMPI